MKTPSLQQQIRDLIAERDAYREALHEIAHNTSTSIPLGESAARHYERGMRRCIGIAARALNR